MEAFIQYMEDYRKLVRNTFLSDEHQGTMAGNVTGMPSHDTSPWNKVMNANNRAQLLFVPYPTSVKINLFVTQDVQALFKSDSMLGWWMLSVEKVDTHLISGCFSYRG